MISKSLIKTAIISFFLLAFVPSLYAEDINVEALLKLVREGQARDNSAFNERMTKFKLDKSNQEKLLIEAKSERLKLENASVSKEAEFAQNEAELADSQDRLNTRLGGLKELFGVLQQIAGDTQSQFEDSVISAEIPNREEFLKGLISKAGSSSELPSMSELEKLWFEMQREMTYSSYVSQFDAEVVLPNGQSETRHVIRIGGFNLVSNGKYLTYDSENKKIIELASQPSSRYTSTIADLESATGNDTVGFWVDPSRGQLLRIIGQSAGLNDRIQQGGIVGYIILALGIVAIIIAFVRIAALTAESKRISRQMKEDDANDNNALGRVMKVYIKNQSADLETLELHLAEAISAEVPRLTRGISWIKIISVVSPLLGLLGTVTGMIDVFETMSLFGTGDPKLMAGGISQALVTTVQGLIVAIPCVFFHNMTSNRSRKLIVILEERATGIMARKSEESHAAEKQKAA
jgi:biopolymer transport protein ExbB